MMEETTTTLDNIPANRATIEMLYTQELLTASARERALNLIHPPKNWGLWAGRILLFIGTALILAGIIYFFAFNWHELPPLAKLGLIEGGILCCLLAAYFFGLETVGGKILLIAVSFLVGVFLAVFGQIYQTGADVYQLFMVWAILIAGWVSISQFAPLWMMWLIIINLFLSLYWQQMVVQSTDKQIELFIYLILLNSVFLAAREFFAQQGLVWLQSRWIRAILVIAILGFALVPIITFIIDYETVEQSMRTSIILGATLGIAIHLIFLWFYRYQSPDIAALAITVLSLCIIAEVTFGRFISWREPIGTFLLMAIFTVVLFTVAVNLLYRTTQQMEVKNVH